MQSIRPKEDKTTDKGISNPRFFFLFGASTQSMDHALQAFDRLLAIMDELREKCPWDRKQTMESLRHLTIEETFELSEAILEGDMEEVKKELGDVLLHIVLYARIGSEKAAFNITEIIQTLCEKLIRRHPHIYGQAIAQGTEAVTKSWEKIKLKEEAHRSVLDGVPKSLPSLIKALRLQQKTDGIGLDWGTTETAWKNLKAQLEALSHTAEPSPASKLVNTPKQEAWGALLFSLVNYARLSNINLEESLERESQRFTKCFQAMEQQIIKEGKQLADLSEADIEYYWQKTRCARE